eukprot:COSAG01_NODE_6560_length_3609_cov_2.918234_1_plen_60_part_00
MRHFRYAYPLELTLTIVFHDYSKNGWTDHTQVIRYVQYPNQFTRFFSDNVPAADSAEGF